MRPRRFESRFRNPPLGAHRCLACEKVGERRLALARGRFELAQLRRDPRTFVLGVRKPLLDRRALLAKLFDRSSGVRLERLFALDILSRSAFETVELRQPAGDGVAARPGRRQLMSDFAASSASVRGRSAALGQPFLGFLLDSAKRLDLGQKSLDFAFGGGSVALGLLGRRIGLGPARVNEPRLDRPDLVAQLAIALGRSRLPA
jgi:hypothetical protein